MKFNYSKLRGRIRTVFKSEEVFASKMGLSTRTLSLKLNNKVYFKQSEIIKAITLLGLSRNDIMDYFFNLDV